MKTIILDMYGVIMTDPTANLVAFINKYFPGTTFEDIEDLWKLADTGVLSSIEFLQKLGFKNNTEEIQYEYLETLLIDTEFYQFAEKLSNRCQLVLLSNDVSEWSSYIRKKYNIDKYFKLLAISGDIGIRKPSKASFEFVLNKLGQTSSECIFVDDRRENLLGAEQVGINTVLFNKRNVPYGENQVNNFDDLFCFCERFITN